jgi:hypothetical protein
MSGGVSQVAWPVAAQGSARLDAASPSDPMLQELVDGEKGDDRLKDVSDQG